MLRRGSGRPGGEWASWHGVRDRRDGRLEPTMTPRLALFLLMGLLPACSPATAPVEGRPIERGTALPPPGLASPVRN